MSFKVTCKKNCITSKLNILVILNPEKTESIGFKEFAHVTMEAEKPCSAL